MAFCYSCFNKIRDDYMVCPYCGASKNMSPLEPIHLHPGTLLNGRYIIGQAVGGGGFGIIYKAFDTKFGTTIAVKEFYSSALMNRVPGNDFVTPYQKKYDEFAYRKKRYLAEARTMAKFSKHKNIPKVYEYFEANNTAYIVMELLEGMALNDYLRENNGVIDSDFAIMIVGEIANALQSLHEAGVIHRDVAPDNIYICNGEYIGVKLLDLGAAKLSDDTDDVIDIVLKPGYSATEQYDDFNDIGPYLDVYALGATMYCMLTGNRPDESTNRKTVLENSGNDTILPPHMINPAISENLSNAIMKAMAVEKHMRYKSVDAFVKAITGEKRVYTIAEEKKKRNRKRLISIIAALVLVAVASVFAWKIYGNKKADQELRPAEISVWYSVEKDSDEKDAMDAVIEDFRTTFPHIEIMSRAIPSEEYEEEIKKAASEGKLPNLFESSGLEDSLISGAVDLADILQSEQADDCYFLNQYNKFYDDYKRMPLAFELPLAYVITSGYTSIDYNSDYFEAVKDFGDAEIAVDERNKELITDNYSVSDYKGIESFMNNSENSCAVMLSSSVILNDVRESLTNYQKKYVYPDADKIFCNFIYEWSVGSGDETSVAAAKRLLEWMLGNNYQNMLMISVCADGQLPVSRECLKNRMTNKYYSAIEKIIPKMIFDR